MRGPRGTRARRPRDRGGPWRDFSRVSCQRPCRIDPSLAGSLPTLGTWQSEATIPSRHCEYRNNRPAVPLTSPASAIESRMRTSYQFEWVAPTNPRSSLPDVSIVSLICRTRQMSASAPDECRYGAWGCFQYFGWEPATRPGHCRLWKPASSDRGWCDGAGSETVAYFSSGFRIFTSSPCTYSFPQTTCPVFSGSSLPSMPEIVPPASRTMICPAAMSQGCRLRSQ